MWMDRIKAIDFETILQRARICSQEIAEHGDNILYRSKKKGESAVAFNRLAEGIACLVFVAGGVTIFGLHFEAKKE